MAEPMVSVIIAAFRGGAHLQEAVRSALAQDWPNFEVIVSDDSDGDEIRDWVASLTDARLTYRRNPRTLGPAANHRAAIHAARGEYVGILNDDDRWQPDFLSRLAPPLQNNRDLVLAFCDHVIMNSEGKLLQAETEENRRRWGRDVLREGEHRPFHALAVAQSIPLAMGAVFRRSAISSDDPPDE